MRTSRLTVVLAGLALAGSAFAQMGGGSASAPAAPAKDFSVVKQEVLTDMERVLGQFAFVPGVDFKQWPKMLEAKKADLDAAQTNEEFVRAVNGALQEFKFSHIVLFSPQAAEARRTNSMVGIGVRIQIEENGIRVTMVFPEGPAGKAGIQPGDLITEANGKPVRQPGDLAGEEGSSVKVVVQRGGETLSFDMNRARFNTRIPESVKWVDADTAMVTIPTFDLAYNRENVDKVMGEAARAKNLILDLRSNGGGAVVNLMHLAGYFLDPSKQQNLGTFVDRSMYEGFQRANPDRKDASLADIATWARRPIGVMPRTQAARVQGRVVVLVDGGTGSASEMMAASLREHMGATVLGQKSAGAVLASVMRPIANNYLLQFPLTDYVTTKGYRIEGNGVKPDREVETLVRFGEEDKAVAAALEAFRTMASKSGS